MSHNNSSNSPNSLNTLKRHFLEYTEIEKGRSLKTVENYDRYLNLFLEFLKSDSPADVTEEKLREYRLFLNRRSFTTKTGNSLIKKRTQNYYLIALRAYLKYMSKRGLQILSPDNIELAKVPERQIDHISIEELDRILSAPNDEKDEKKRLRDKAILELLFSTGLRVSELCSIPRDLDLNKDEFETVELLDRHEKTWTAQVAKTILNSDYLISIGPPKTHDEVVYTGAIKNIAVGSLLRPEGSFAAKIASKFGIVKNNKAMIHQGHKILNKNIALLAKKIRIDLAILDGFSAMQGNGPGRDGELVPAHWAIASGDALSADLLALSLMGIKLKDVGYLSILNENNTEVDPFVIGDNWKKAIKQFKMHHNFENIRKWR